MFLALFVMVSSHVAFAMVFQFSVGSEIPKRATGHISHFKNLTDSSYCLTHVRKVDTPSSVDWSPQMNAVRDQGNCGGCHTFSTIASLEGASMVAGNPVELSEQQVIDCLNPMYNTLLEPDEHRPNPDIHKDWHVNAGCGGGNAVVDIHHFMKGGWISSGGGDDWCACSRDTYKYTASPHDDGVDGETYREPQQQCKEKTCTCALKKDAVKNCYFVKPDGFSNPIEALKNAVAQQPIAIAVDDSQLSWGDHDGKGKDVVMPDDISGCNDHQKHAVTLVGFGVDEHGTQYWKIRNSWGPEWAFGGHVKVNMNAGGSKGPLCMYTAEGPTQLGLYPEVSPIAPQVCHGTAKSQKFQCTAGTHCCGSHTAAPSCIDYKYNSCCEHNGKAIACAKGSKCSHLAGSPICLPFTVAV